MSTQLKIREFYHLWLDVKQKRDVEIVNIFEIFAVKKLTRSLSDKEKIKIGNILKKFKKCWSKSCRSKALFEAKLNNWLDLEIFDKISSGVSGFNFLIANI